MKQSIRVGNMMDVGRIIMTMIQENQVQSANHLLQASTMSDRMFCLDDGTEGGILSLFGTLQHHEVGVGAFWMVGDETLIALVQDLRSAFILALDELASGYDRLVSLAPATGAIKDTFVALGFVAERASAMTWRLSYTPKTQNRLLH